MSLRPPTSSLTVWPNRLVAANPRRAFNRRRFLRHHVSYPRISDPGLGVSAAGNSYDDLLCVSEFRLDLAVVCRRHHHRRADHCYLRRIREEARGSLARRGWFEGL